MVNADFSVNFLADWNVNALFCMSMEFDLTPVGVLLRNVDRAKFFVFYISELVMSS